MNRQAPTEKNKKNLCSNMCKHKNNYDCNMLIKAYWSKNKVLTNKLNFNVNAKKACHSKKFNDSLLQKLLLFFATAGLKKSSDLHVFNASVMH